MQNADANDGIWVVFMKKSTGIISLNYDEAVEEALCFGWIDSLPRKLDEERHLLLFTPRKPKSPWSKLNKSRIDSLQRSGLMTERGQRLIDDAKSDGSWSTYDEAEELSLPDDLLQALNMFPNAISHWNNFSPSSKKGILWWIKSAKTEVTRNRRIQETAQMAAKGFRANFPADKQKFAAALLRQSGKH
jgi:uncharacterized protein YdeI (YjbR/CyaY-like superfamily)